MSEISSTPTGPTPPTAPVGSAAPPEAAKLEKGEKEAAEKSTMKKSEASPDTASDASTVGDKPKIPKGDKNSPAAPITPDKLNQVKRTASGATDKNNQIQEAKLKMMKALEEGKPIPQEALNLLSPEAQTEIKAKYEEARKNIRLQFDKGGGGPKDLSPVNMAQIMIIMQMLQLSASKAKGSEQMNQIKNLQTSWEIAKDEVKLTQKLGELRAKEHYIQAASAGAGVVTAGLQAGGAAASKGLSQKNIANQKTEKRQKIAEHMKTGTQEQQAAFRQYQDQKTAWKALTPAQKKEHTERAQPGAVANVDVIPNPNLMKTASQFKNADPTLKAMLKELKDIRSPQAAREARDDTKRQLDAMSEVTKSNNRMLEQIMLAQNATEMAKTEADLKGVGNLKDFARTNQDHSNQVSSALDAQVNQLNEAMRSFGQSSLQTNLAAIKG